MLTLGRRSAFGAAVLALTSALACGAAGDAGTTGSMGSTGGGGGGAAVPENHPASEACAVFPQAGCDVDHTCTVVTPGGATLCVGAGPTAVGGYCANDGDCAVGLACVGDLCRAFCAAPADCTGGAPTCFDVYSNQKVIPGFKTCALPCNPADPANKGGIEGVAACPGGFTCFPLGADVGPQGSTDCGLAGNAGPGAACAPGDCRAGLVCLNNGSSSVCTPRCLLGGGQCNCASYAQPQYVALPSGIKEVGYCQ